MSDKTATHYIIVVHGMGQSRPFENLLPVISRFGEARQSQQFRWTAKRDAVTLGAIAGAIDSNRNGPWVAFSHIPRDSDVEADRFTGVPLTEDPDGKYLRFVDIHWADIFEAPEHQALIEPLTNWGDGMVSRLEQYGRKDGNNHMPTWMRQLLYKTQDLIIPLQFALRFFNKNIENMLFSKFLGDVQIYGEYPLLRGKAVGRFHQKMFTIHQGALANDEAPVYTILAHSLGTVMSLDALMYAHAAADQRSFSAFRRSDIKPAANMPFPGYQKPGGSNSAAGNPVAWIHHVEHFITMGSPIDKFLLLWWPNYEYMNETHWISEDLKGRCVDRPIAHYNYCEEQDPVGSTLDELRTRAAYRDLFVYESPQKALGKTQMPFLKKGEVSETSPVVNKLSDIVYRRSVIPGAAHVSYWSDLDLFKNILHNISPKNLVKYMVSDRKGTYPRMLLISYLLIPLVVIFACGLPLTFAIGSKSWIIVLVAGLTFIFTAWFSRETLNLQIWWRQLLRNQQSKEIKVANRGSIFASNIWGKWTVRIGMPMAAVFHGFLSISAGGKAYQTNGVAPEISGFNPGSAMEILGAPLALVRNPYVLIFSLLLGSVFMYGYLLNRSKLRARPLRELFYSFIVEIITFVISFIVLSFIGSAVGNGWEYREITPRPLAILLAAGSAIIFITLIRSHFFKTDEQSDRRKVVVFFKELFVALVVLVIAAETIDYLLTAFSTTLKPVSVLQPDINWHPKDTIFPLYCLLSTVIWSFLTLRFYVAKQQLAGKS